MSKKSSEKKPVVGRPWRQVGVFSSFEEADAKRNKMSEDASTQVKVRYRFESGTYTVHFRRTEESEKTPSKKKGKKSKRGKNLKKAVEQ